MPEFLEVTQLALMVPWGHHTIHVGDSKAAHWLHRRLKGKYVQIQSYITKRHTCMIACCRFKLWTSEWVEHASTGGWQHLPLHTGSTKLKNISDTKYLRPWYIFYYAHLGGDWTHFSQNGHRIYSFFSQNGQRIYLFFAKRTQNLLIFRKTDT